jgi:hypothetical protein
VVEAGYEDLEDEELGVEHADAGLLFEALLGGLLYEEFDRAEELLDDEAELEAAEVDEVCDARPNEVVLFDELEAPSGVAGELVDEPLYDASDEDVAGSVDCEWRRISRVEGLGERVGGVGEEAVGGVVEVAVGKGRREGAVGGVVTEARGAADGVVGSVVVWMLLMLMLLLLRMLVLMLVLMRMRMRMLVLE